MTTTVPRNYYAGADPSRSLSIEDLQARAHRRLPPSVVEYIEGGADAEASLHGNRRAFGDLRPVEDVDLHRDLSGQRSSAPFAIAPSGFNGLFWPDGDMALARAAAKAGIAFAQSTVSNALLEDVAASDGPRHCRMSLSGGPRMLRGTPKAASLSRAHAFPWRAISSEMRSL